MAAADGGGAVTGGGGTHPGVCLPICLATAGVIAMDVCAAAAAAAARTAVMTVETERQVASIG
eukprot:COSAG01_NODE_2091_length_8453_cov_19.448049_4_plen_63_part_00